MPRLLLIAYHFPPEPAAGARRPGFLAKYLPLSGWEVTVLTRPLGLQPDFPCRVVTARPLGARFDGVRGAWRLKEMLFFPDPAAGWLPTAIARGLALTASERFDAVLSTAMPASVHVAGAAIAHLRGLPWIADYRDAWTGNPYVHRGAIRSRLERALERLLIRRADNVTSISAAIAAQLERLHRRPVAAIPNAADPSEWARYEAVEPDAFELCYTGSLYDGRRSPAMLFEALAELRRQNDPAACARVAFYGPDSGNIGSLARTYGVESNVEQHGIVSHERAMRAQRSASNLLVFLSTDSQTVRELGSKIFEYAAARRPVVAFGPRESALRDYVLHHRLGWFVSDVQEAKTALREAHRRFIAGDCELHLEPGAVHDARDLAATFARELNALLAA